MLLMLRLSWLLLLLTLLLWQAVFGLMALVKDDHIVAITQPLADLGQPGRGTCEMMMIYKHSSSSSSKQDSSRGTMVLSTPL